MAAITVTVITVSDKVSPDIARIINGMENTRPMMARVGGDIAKVLRAHFRGKGGATFWGEIADATNVFNFDHQQATIGVSPPQGYYVLHKLKGGTVTAKPPRKYMAIPANSQARAAGWPSHWSGPGDGKLKVLYGKNGPYALALAQNLMKWGRKGGPKMAKTGGNWGQGVIMYWLKKSVTHKPDPDAVPSDSVIEGVAVASITAYVNGLLKNRPQT
jgi:hypothetical protein